MFNTIRAYIQDRIFPKHPTTRRIPGRYKVRDGAFANVITYRMGGLFPGSVTRTHPQWIEPCLIHPQATYPLPGNAVMLHQSDNSVLPVDGTFVAGPIYGVAVRAYPTQPMVMDATGNITTSSPEVDVMREGYIGVAVVGTPLKGGSAWIWVAATALPHVQGGFEAAASGASTVQLTNCKFNGPADANGNAELIITIAQP